MLAKGFITDAEALWEPDESIVRRQIHILRHPIIDLTGLRLTSTHPTVRAGLGQARKGEVF